jgi:hypothetical protein
VLEMQNEISMSIKYGNGNFFVVLYAHLPSHANPTQLLPLMKFARDYFKEFSRRVNAIVTFLQVYKEYKMEA